MATDTERLLIEIAADTRQLRGQLDKSAIAVNKAARKMQRSFADAGQAMRGSMGKVVAAVAAVGTAVAGIGVAEKLVTTNAEFQKLKATLETFLGTRAKAEATFDVIRQFAAQTPNSVAEVTQAFNRMLATGISPTIRALNAFGNVAAGSGKTVIDFTEAVADAAVNEFERLKEFGIKASKQGDKVSLTFKGITKTVAASSTAITEALTQIGETEFGGAMARQSKTLTGAFSNMGDAVDGFLTRMGDAGLNDALIRLAQTIGNLANGNGDLATSFGRILGSGVDAIPGIMEGVARAVLFVRDNMKLLVQVFAAWFGMKVAVRVVEITKSFILYAKAINAVKVVNLAWAAVQKRTMWGLLAMGGMIAVAVGRLKELREELEKIAVELLPVFDAGLDKVSDLAKVVGVDFSALTSEISGFSTGTAGALPSIEHLDRTLLSITGGARSAKTAIAESKSELQKLAEASTDVGQALDERIAGGLKNIGSGLLSAARSSQTAADAFRNMATRIIDSLLELVIEMTVVRFAAQAMHAAIQGFGGFSGGGASMGANSAGVMGVPGGVTAGRAIGGPVLPNRVYEVGEMGRELFVPQTAGRIVPNNQIGGDTISIALHLSTGVSQEVAAQIRGVLPEIQNRVVTAVVDAKRRGKAGMRA